MTATAKMKSDFRKSKLWQIFRHNKNVEQKGLDPITECKLTKTSNCHHCDLDPDNYKDLSNKTHFILINKATHDVIHWCLRYIKKYHSMKVIDNLYNEVYREAILNNYIYGE